MPSICSAVFVVASAAAPPSGSLVEEAAFIAPVLDGSPALRIISEPLRRAEAALQRARLAPNPRVEFGREAPEGNPSQSTWTLGWIPPLDGRRGLAVRAARRGVDAASARLAAEQTALRLELRQVFADWSLATARRDVLASEAERVGTLAEQAAARSRAGEESGLAARRLALAAEELRAELAQGEAAAARARAVARAWRPDLDPAAQPARPPLPIQGDLDATPAHGLEALRHEAQQAQLEERLNRRYWTFPELRVGWQRLGGAGPDLAGPVLGFAVAVPVFERNQGGRLEAAARREAAAARLALATARLAAELPGAREAYGRLADAARRAADVAAESDRIVEAATAAFRGGEASTTDLLDTLRAAREARTRALEVYAAALAAHRQLEAVAAGLPEGGLR